LGFESGPRAFDDLWVEYAPGRGPKDAHGRPVLREHIQCKWHVDSGTYGYADLILPDFIGATSASLLQRAHAAQASHAPSGEGVRFSLVTNWHPLRDDPLRELVYASSGALRLDALFEGKTDRSRMGKVRQAWREHLGIDDNGLRPFASMLGFVQWALPPEHSRAWLNDAFQIAGLRTVPVSQSSFPHEDVIFRWMAQGKKDFDATSLRAACESEDLLGEAKERPEVFGVKSFEHSIDRLEDRCSEVLNLVPAFHDRFIQDETDWSASLYPQLHTFLTEAARNHDHLRLALDAHTTLAFAAGAVLDVKSGRDIELEQRTSSREVWRLDRQAPNAEWPRFNPVLVELGQQAPDIAVAVGLTHDIRADVQNYVNSNLPSVGRILNCMLPSGAGPASVRNGAHAALLAHQLAQAVSETRMPGVSRTIHLFMAAPNGFSFLAGQRRALMGRVTLYEFDFGQAQSGSYTPSLTLPLASAPSAVIAPSPC
jgi:hypothetical protein